MQLNNYTLTSYEQRKEKKKIIEYVLGLAPAVFNPECTKPTCHYSADGYLGLEKHLLGKEESRLKASFSLSGLVYMS